MASNQRVLDILNKPLDADGRRRQPRPDPAGRALRPARRAGRGADRGRQPPRGGASPRTPQLQGRADPARRRATSKLAAARPRSRARQPVTLGVTEPFMQTLKVSRLRGPADLAAADPLPGLRVRPAGVLPAREAGGAPRHVGSAVPIHWWSRVRLLHGRPARDRVPPELQHGRVRRPDPGAAVLQVRADAPDRDGAAFPDPRWRSSPSRGSGSSPRASSRTTAATRSSSSPCSPCCCPARTRSRWR